ncbi:MAG: hypothetical protein GX748_13975 [Lentisphaerae bacterium]|nr:hypothetical protein [Lentisphaerota bacterium]
MRSVAVGRVESNTKTSPNSSQRFLTRADDQAADGVVVDHAGRCSAEIDALRLDQLRLARLRRTDGLQRRCVQRENGLLVLAAVVPVTLKCNHGVGIASHVAARADLDGTVGRDRRAGSLDAAVPRGSDIAEVAERDRPSARDRQVVSIQTQRTRWTSARAAPADVDRAANGIRS